MWSRQSSAWVRRAPRYSSLSGRPIWSHVSAAAARWRRCAGLRRRRRASRAGAARPGPSLVGELDGVAVAGDQPGADQLLDQLLGSASIASAAARQPDPYRLAVGAGSDEAQQEVAQQRPPLGGEGLVDLLRRSGRRRRGCRRRRDSRRPSTCAPHDVPRSGAARGTAEAGRPVRPPPRARGGRPVLVRAAGRPDGPAPRSPPAGRPRPSPRAGTARVRRPGRTPASGDIGEVVGAQGDDERRPLSASARAVKNRACSAGSAHRRDGLLALVDDQHGVAVRRRRGECVQRGAPGVTTTTRRPSRCNAAATPARTSDDLPLPDGRRRPGHRRRQPAQALGDLDVTAEEAVGVVDVERNEPGYGHTGLARPARRGDQGGVLTQDRLLQGDQLGPGSTPSSVASTVRAWRSVRSASP